MGRDLYDLFGRRRPARRVRLRDQVPTEMVTQSQNLGVRREKSSVSSVGSEVSCVVGFFLGFLYNRFNTRAHGVPSARTALRRCSVNG